MTKVRRWYSAHERGKFAAPSFASLAPEYQRLWDTMILKAEKRDAIVAEAKTIKNCSAQYRNVSQIVPAVPWAMVGLFDMMEGGGGARTHLHNGDSLSGYTRHVPAGRPKIGHGPPFKFVESAVDALKYEGFDKITSWSIPRICFTAESMNGFGYRNHGVNSAYLWSYSNQYQRGKYVADGVWDANVVSQQVGVMPLLKVLFEIEPAANFLGSPAPTPQPQPPDPPSNAQPWSLWQSLADAINALFGRR